MKIYLSQIKACGFADAAAFVSAVDKHINALRAHQVTTGEESPTSHAIVEHCVRRVQFPVKEGKPDEFVADFEVVNDGPTFDQIKSALLTEVARAEQMAIAAVIPLGKRRLFAQRERDILDREAAARPQPSLLAKLTGALPKDPAELRSKEDAAFMADLASWRAHIVKIERLAAQALHDVEDLTTETIGDFKLPSFQG